MSHALNEIEVELLHTLPSHENYSTPDAPGVIAMHTYTYGVDSVYTITQVWNFITFLTLLLSCPSSLFHSLFLFLSLSLSLSSIISLLSDC